MNTRRTGAAIAFAVGLVTTAIMLSGIGAGLAAQEKPQAAASPVILEVGPGTRASYRVQEQLAGISFPSDAVGTTEACSGKIVLLPDGSVDSSQSKLRIDLRTLTTDQERRDAYVRNRTLETEKFPFVEFVPKRFTGLNMPLPKTGVAEFQMIGDLTIKGVTKEVTWKGYVTFTNAIAGRAITDITFDTFGLVKPKLAGVLSVADKIQLELNFRMNRSGA